MNKRNYNVFFHLHTVSGIVISVALYIIFFAGAFALIKDEITAWEKGDTVQLEQALDVDYDKITAVIKEEGYNLEGRNIRLVMPDVKQEVLVILSGSKYEDASDEDKQGAFFYINTINYTRSDYYTFYSFGELIYRLHFFSQIPKIGTYLAGFVALFFLFAITTGIIVHWKKIISNFYVFRPKAKFKTIWTDAHTALGVIGLPFQFVYAVTSCFLCLSILVLIPGNFIYNNNQKKLSEDLRPMTKDYPITYKTHTEFSLNPFMEQTLEKWETFSPSQVYIRNYGDSNMKFQVDGMVSTQQKFIGHGRIVYNVPTNDVLSIKDPLKSNYIEAVEMTVRKLHFGDFGGYWLKLVYFIMAFITCFVIISGVLIWLEARNKKNVPEKRRKYNEKVGHIYLAICLSMYPITALSMIVSKLIPRSLDASRLTILYCVFFGGWLLLSIFFRFKRDNYFTNKYTLLIGSILGFLIPIVNGISSGNWFWITFQNGQTAIFLIDAFWIVLSTISTLIILKMNKKILDKN
ncbi:PepSY-associated TM helix domain-containing protein [Urechidicola croceus]|uniref:Peptidase n=1 Tax=Urechidicola croceus TaxID=1850246 RepID=A0A1D8PB00_9FLAO|nr:PepSY-associated TM helix domain-containing protein [Urechidicola croceus]AOW21754.1 hypothetical protein LPB138_14170 [Urechidicola croceus]